MSNSHYPISPYTAELSRKNLREMIRLVHKLSRLSQNPNYQTLIQQNAPLTAQVNLNHYSVMMGYDFHLSPTGPKLIEVNTNAGGLWLAFLCYQPDAKHFAAHLGRKILQTFLNDYQLFRKNPQTKPEFIVILDDQPEQQFLYPEMQVFAQLFQQNGIETAIISPENLVAKTDGLYLNNKRIDMIYNRHCDFYLESPEMAAVRTAWLKQQVCLSPNPFMYGLLADKRRMTFWSDTQKLHECGLSAAEITFFQKLIPQTLPLTSLNSNTAWETRKRWVFKPVSSHGSRGVYVGDKLTKGKLAELNPEQTLIQEHVPASMTRIRDDLAFKTDYRLFVYHNRILAVSARLYQGQVTNLRTENGGFAKVRLLP